MSKQFNFKFHCSSMFSNKKCIAILTNFYDGNIMADAKTTRACAIGPSSIGLPKYARERGAIYLQK